MEIFPRDHGNIIYGFQGRVTQAIEQLAKTRSIELLVQTLQAIVEMPQPSVSSKGDATQRISSTASIKASLSQSINPTTSFITPHQSIPNDIFPSNLQLSSAHSKLHNQHEYLT
jgi:hypothetical protein